MIIRYRASCPMGLTWLEAEDTTLFGLIQELNLATFGASIGVLGLPFQMTVESLILSRAISSGEKLMRNFPAMEVQRVLHSQNVA